MDSQRVIQDEQQRVAVWLRLGDSIRSDVAGSSRPVFDHEGLFHACSQLVCQDAGGEIRRAAGGERDDDLDRPRRIVFGVRDCAGEHGAQEGACGKTQGSAQDRHENLHPFAIIPQPCAVETYSSISDI
jgi:hypothetical protein